MREVPTIGGVQERLFAYMIGDYDGSVVKVEKSILFELTHDNETLIYTLTATPEELKLSHRAVDTPSLIVWCRAFDWIAVAGDELNPIFASITGRIKFIGDAENPLRNQRG